MSGDTGRAWTWRHLILKSNLSSTTRHVLLTLSCYMNEVGGGCYPTQETLAEASGLTVRAVRTHLEVAEKAGWLKRTEHGFRGQRWRNTEYWALWPEPLDVDEGEEPRSAPSEQRTGTSRPKVRKDVPTTSPDTSNPPLTPKPVTGGLPQDVANGFSELWGTWPEAAKGSYEAAWGAWKAMTAGERSALLAALPVVIQALSRRWFHKSLTIPNLTSFIRDRAFLEYCGDAPSLDDDGYFVITSDRPEWTPWTAALRRTHGGDVAERAQRRGMLLNLTRWPPGYTPPK